MKDFGKTKEEIYSMMQEISGIIKSNGMSGICIFYKQEDAVLATPALLAGSPINLIPAIVRVMQESPDIRNVILAAYDYYEHKKEESTMHKEIPPYLEELIKQLFKNM